MPASVKAPSAMQARVKTQEIEEMSARYRPRRFCHAPLPSLRTLAFKRPFKVAVRCCRSGLRRRLERGDLVMDAVVCSPDGQKFLREKKSLRPPTGPRNSAHQVAESLGNAGAGEILHK